MFKYCKKIKDKYYPDVWWSSTYNCWMGSCWEDGKANSFMMSYDRTKTKIEIQTKLNECLIESYRSSL